MARVLVVDDEESVCQMLRDLLEAEGYEVVTALEPTKALALLEQLEVNAALVDIRMPEMDGLTFFKLLKERGYAFPVVIMTAYGSTDTAIEAMKLGAFDYVLKPFNIEELLLTLKRAVEVEALAQEARALKKELAGGAPAEELLGRSPAMIEVFKEIGKFADTDYTVLIMGETGTGKELVAGALHRNSRRRQGPFVRINCAAIPENLLESELFGYEKGAFTGATSRKLGKFELAEGGTLFLDEIGEFPLTMQPKLLRVLQEKEFERVGGTKTVRVDVRIIAATNQDLERMVKEGSFREDLYYRLNVVTIRVPPLRERKEDISLLAEHFLRQAASRLGKPVQGFSSEALAILHSYDWPGNVRELRNVCERAVVLAQGMLVLPEDLPLTLREHRELGLEEGELAFKLRSGQTLAEILQDVERTVILKALQEHNFNRTRTAQALGISRRTLHLKLKEYGLGEGKAGE
ncbi:sigma-54-dependent transcriptional regulator [Desulfothermobacter acidiphilus]|uniref:sigma-54-dependent transcriptional regulator n=1 Tax=Desulfothermobacter acidiphilus TaxID=1938353 RepID=UPI003F899FBD